MAHELFTDRILENNQAISVESHENIYFKPIILGSLISFLLGIAILFLGSGIGLMAFNFERGEFPSGFSLIGAILYFSTATFLTFYFCGYAIVKVARIKDQFSGTLHGLAMFALSTVLVMIVLASSTFSSMGSLLTKTGIGIGSATGATAILDQITKMQIVMDMQLLKGKAVIQIVNPAAHQAESLNQTLDKAKQETKNVVEKVDETLQSKLRDIRRGTAKASISILFLLLLGSFAASFGGFSAVKQS